MSFAGYDDWKSRDYASEDGPRYFADCPVCEGTPDADPCSPECEEIMEQVRRSRVIRRNYEACRRAIHLARLYQTEGGPRDTRIGLCVVQIRSIRTYIATLRKAS